MIAVIKNIISAFLKEILREISNSGTLSGNYRSSATQRNISLAVQKGVFVNVYDANNRQIFYKQGQLHGYTNSTVSVRENGFVIVYDVNGKRMGSQYIGSR